MRSHYEDLGPERKKPRLYNSQRSEGLQFHCLACDGEQVGNKRKRAKEDDAVGMAPGAKRVKVEHRGHVQTRIYHCGLCATSDPLRKRKRSQVDAEAEVDAPSFKKARYSAVNLRSIYIPSAINAPTKTSPVVVKTVTAEAITPLVAAGSPLQGTSAINDEVASNNAAASSSDLAASNSDAAVSSNDVRSNDVGVSSNEVCTDGVAVSTSSAAQDVVTADDPGAHQDRSMIQDVEMEVDVDTASEQATITKCVTAGPFEEVIQQEARHLDSSDAMEEDVITTDSQMVMDSTAHHETPVEMMDLAVVSEEVEMAEAPEAPAPMNQGVWDAEVEMAETPSLTQENDIASSPLSVATPPQGVVSAMQVTAWYGSTAGPSPAVVSTATPKNATKIAKTMTRSQSTGVNKVQKHKQRRVVKKESATPTPISRRSATPPEPTPSASEPTPSEPVPAFIAAPIEQVSVPAPVEPGFVPALAEKKFTPETRPRATRERKTVNEAASEMRPLSTNRLARTLSNLKPLGSTKVQKTTKAKAGIITSRSESVQKQGVLAKRGVAALSAMSLEELFKSTAIRELTEEEIAEKAERYRLAREAKVAKAKAREDARLEAEEALSNQWATNGMDDDDIPDGIEAHRGIALYYLRRGQPDVILDHDSLDEAIDFIRSAYPGTQQAKNLPKKNSGEEEEEVYSHGTGSKATEWGGKKFTLSVGLWQEVAMRIMQTDVYAYDPKHCCWRSREVMEREAQRKRTEKEAGKLAEALGNWGGLEETSVLLHS